MKHCTICDKPSVRCKGHGHSDARRAQGESYLDIEEEMRARGYVVNRKGSDHPLDRHAHNAMAVAKYVYKKLR